MENVHHEGYEVSPATMQRTDNGEWTLRVLITKHRDSKGVTNEKFFDGENTFKTKDEAEMKSIEFGKRIINGELSGFDVHDL